ncbi:MAG: steryl acetyl hydrolase [Oxalobacteraceae bacterium]|nr:MAG: steryl acetyl hydrolase [Oxalobacteraceae bacterium]
MVPLSASSFDPTDKANQELDMKRRIALPAVALGLLLAIAGVFLAREQGSMAMRAATLALKAGGKPLADLEAVKRSITSRRYPSPAPIPPSLAAQVTVERQQIGGNPVITLTPRVRASRWHIIYYHGGAYVNEITKPHWDIIGALIKATGATVTVPIYPLSPEQNNRDAFPFMTEVYRQIVATTAAGNVILVGDSAGGGLAIGEALELRRQGLPAPARLILFSPWLDLTMADPAARTVEPVDVMLTVDSLRAFGKMWAAGDDARLARLSPLYAELGGLPPIDLYQGTHDIFVVDARTFVRKVKLAGGAIHYGEYPGAFHVFVGATFTPEAKQVFREIGTVIPRGAANEK